MSKKFAWAALPDEQLLKVRLKNLHVKVEGTWLEDCLLTLHDELAEHGLNGAAARLDLQRMVQPGGVAGHRRAVLSGPSAADAAGKEDDIDVEGGTWNSCMRILRHEAGHVVQHAYRLHRRRRWQQLFGPTSKRYPRYYQPDPASRNYVQHLRLWYAQSHPDEDFAETFAVWLRPRSNWRTRYNGWPALKKLRYVDELMREIAGKRPFLSNREKVDPLSTFTETLGEHYKNKRALYLVDPPRTYDRDLLPAVLRGSQTSPRRDRGVVPAPQPRPECASWSPNGPANISSRSMPVLDDMIARCRELKLRAVGSERQAVIDFTILLTAKTMHALFGPSRRRWIAL